MDCSPPSSSVHGILRARILKWLAISFSRWSSRPRDPTWIFYIESRFCTIWATREALAPVAVSFHFIFREPWNGLEQYMYQINFNDTLYLKLGLYPQSIPHLPFSSVQSLSHVWLFVTPWTAARQASLSITNSWSLVKLMSHRVGDVIQPSHPLSFPSPPALNLAQHQGPFKWVSSLHQVAKILEFQLQHQSFQWIFRTDFL